MLKATFFVNLMRHIFFCQASLMKYVGPWHCGNALTGAIETKDFPARVLLSSHINEDANSWCSKHHVTSDEQAASARHRRQGWGRRRD